MIQQEKKLTPYILVREDGRQETVYLSDPVNSGKANAKEGVVMAYFMIGTIVLAMTAYLTFKQINGKK